VVAVSFKSDGSHTEPTLSRGNATTNRRPLCCLSLAPALEKSLGQATAVLQTMSRASRRVLPSLQENPEEVTLSERH
jgi:hypothetical protein